MARRLVPWWVEAVVVEAKNQWLRFLDVLADVMIRFEADQKFSMDEAYSSLAEFNSSIEPEIVEFAENTIFEIGGFPKGYADVLRLAQGKVSKEVFKRYMTS